MHVHVHTRACICDVCVVEQRLVLFLADDEDQRREFVLDTWILQPLFFGP